MMTMHRFSFRVIIFILAFCSIVYELILANTLAIITDNYIFWHSITIGIYILGLGVGSARSEKVQQSLSSFIHVELSLSILGLLSASYLYMLYGMFSLNDFLQFVHNGYYTEAYVRAAKSSLTVLTIFAQALTFFIGYFSGFEIPLGTELDKKFNENHNENLILSINYIGTLAGTLIFSLYMYTKLDVLYSSYVIAAINFIIVIYLLIHEKKIDIKMSLKVSLLIFMAIIIPQKREWIEQFYLKTTYLTNYYFGKKDFSISNVFSDMKNIPNVYRIKTKYQYIDVYKSSVPEQKKKATILALNTHFQFSTHNEKFYHEAMSHLPINLLHSTPKKILILGGGDGLLLRELLKYPEANITHIELDEGMIELCRNTPWIAKLNQGSLENKRVNRIIGDGFYYLRNTSEKYDLIFIDFPYPDNYNLVKLYTYEFYTYVRRALMPKGSVILDAPIINKENYLKPQFLYRSRLTRSFDEEDFLYNTILYNTFIKAGFKLIFPYKIRREAFLILGSEKRELHFDFDTFDKEKMPALTAQDFYKIQEQDFPYKVDPSMANSLFKPTFLQAVGY